MKDSIQKAINSHREALKLLEGHYTTIREIASLFITTLENKGKIIFIGNGGSAADSQHLAAELVGRFKKNRPGLAAVALTVNSSIITALGNDFGFENVFSRQIESLASEPDIVVAISTSGKSANIVKAVEKAKQHGLKTVGFLGNDGGDLKDIVDISLIIPLFDTPRVQEMHILAGHIICETVENHFA